MQSLSELMTKPHRTGSATTRRPTRNACASATTEEAPPTARPRRIAPSTQDARGGGARHARALAAYLENGGDPAATARLHHMGWSLLRPPRLRARGGPGAAQAHRDGPSPTGRSRAGRCSRPGPSAATSGRRPPARRCGDAASPPPRAAPPPNGGRGAARPAHGRRARGHARVVECAAQAPAAVAVEGGGEASEHVEGDARERVVEVRWRPPPPAGRRARRYVVRGRARRRRRVP